MSVNKEGKKFCDCEVCDNMTEVAALIQSRSRLWETTFASGVHRIPTGLKTQRIVTSITNGRQSKGAGSSAMSTPSTISNLGGCLRFPSRIQSC